MTKRIFTTILLVSSAVLAVGITFVMAILYRYFDGQLEKELQNEAAYLSIAVEGQGTDALEKLPSKSERITVVGTDGSVLYDNHADVSSMENHGDREEIREAQKDGFGYAVRHSGTLGEKTVYYAMRLSDGTVLRVSSTQYTAGVLILNLLHPVIWIAAALLIMSAVFASRAAKKIVEPLNKLDLEHPEANKTYDEIAPLLSKISRQQKTIRQQLHEAKQQQEKFAFIIEHMREGLLVIDSETALLSCNSSALRLLGARNMQPGQSVFALNRSEPFRKAVKAALTGKHVVETMEIHDAYYQITANPVRQQKDVPAADAPAQQIAGAVLVLVDVTDAVQRETLRREFTANVSHELKTPLTSISGYAEIMAEGMVKPEDIPVFSGRIFTEAQRLITLVNDIIKISRLDEGNLRYNKEPVDLLALCRDIAVRLQPVADKAGIDLQVTGSPIVWDLVKPIADEVIYNLCDNAIKYNRPGGSVTVSLSETDARFSVAVADTGIGIPPAEQKRIFERFYRVDKSHSREIGGTGLGLAIVKHGAAFLKAVVTLESAADIGSAFTLTWHKQ